MVAAASALFLLWSCEQLQGIEEPQQTLREPEAQPQLLATVPVASLAAQAARFDAWRQRYLAEADLTRRALLVDEGLAAAAQRRAAMEALVRHHPLLALQAALSDEELAALPLAISSLLERRLDAVGALGLQCTLDEGGAGAVLQAVALVDGRVLRATGPGAEGLVRLRENVRLRGVVAGEWLALESGGAGEGGEALASAYTEGPKTVLYIRVDFSDAPGEPVSQATALATMDGQVAPYYLAQSYGLTSITSTTVTPVLRMPQTLAFYKTNGDYQLQTDARAAAKTAGFDRASYSFDITAFTRVSEWGYAGKAWVGAPGVWLNGYFGMSVTSHELGHNYGLSHANRWNGAGDSIVGDGTHSEYGNQFDVMGGGPNAWAHFNAEFKKRLNWVPAAQVAAASASGTYRLHALESAISSGLHTLSVARPDGKTYWLEFRTQVPNNATAASGAFLLWQVPLGGRGSELLDVTPGTSGSDSALVLGRTFSDRASGIHLTPVAKLSASPAALDVVVQLGSFAGNGRPTAALSASASAVAAGGQVTFTASATDPDGDALAYGWDFGDGTAEGNTAAVTRTFATARDYRVRVTATDMKGGLSSRSVLVRVGAPATFRVSGRVLAGGQPLGEVRITDGSRSAYTDDDGTFTLVGVPAGSFTLTAIKPGFTTSPGFTNPVAVSGNVENLGFTATASGGRTLSGRVLDGTTAMAGVTVSDGTRSAVTDATGAWSLGGVPEGFATLSATKAGWSFLPSGFTSPVQVSGADLANLNFASAGVRIYGSVSGASVATTVTDGYRTAQTVLSGSTWSYNLGPVPQGSFTLTATAPGYTVTPSFTNPVAVGTSSLSGRNFTASTGNQAPVIASPAAANPSPVTGTSAAVSVLGADDGGEGALTYSWSATGPAAVLFSPSGTNAAKAATASFARAGSYVLTATVRDAAGLTATSSVSVTVQAQVAALAVTPASASVPLGGTQAFAAAATDQFGQPVSASVTWSVSGGGSIGSAGLFTAGAAVGGPFTVTATASGRSGTAQVTVTSGGAPTVAVAAAASPNPVGGTTAALSVLGADDGGEAALTYTWSSVSGPAPVSFSPNGTNGAKASTATFSRAGAYLLQVVIRDAGGLSASSQVGVTVQAALTRLSVSPGSASVAAGGSAAFAAAGFDQFDAPLAATVAWSVSGGGTISSAGVFTAGSAAGGPFSVVAASGAVQGLAQVTVTSGDGVAPQVRITSPVAGTVLAEQVAVQVEATDAGGVARVVLLVDGVVRGEKTAAPWTFTLDTRAIGNGGHTLVARATDAAGNAADSAPVAVTIKNRGRKPRIVNLADGMAISGTATVAIDAVDSYIQSLEVTVDPSRVPNGARTLAVVALDAEGAIPSDPVTVVLENPSGTRRDLHGEVSLGCSATGDAGLGALQLLALVLGAARLGRRRR